MFEQFGDFAAGRARPRSASARNSSSSTPRSSPAASDKDECRERLPQLNGVFAFPTTVFLDRKGRVRRIHTGFSGPATGEHYQRLIEDFDATVEQLLAETEDEYGGGAARQSLNEPFRERCPCLPSTSFPSSTRTKWPTPWTRRIASSPSASTSRTPARASS